MFYANDMEEPSIKLKYINGDNCLFNTNKKMELHIDVVCNRSQTFRPPPVTYIHDYDNPCIHRVAMQSANGCSVAAINAIWTFLEKYKGLWGALLILIGFVISMFGRKLFKPTICLLGTAAFVCLSLLFFYSVFFNSNTKLWVGWIILTISVVVGVIVGLLLAKASKLGVAVLAGWGGVCLALILYGAFIHKAESQIVFWLFLVGLAALFAGLSLIMFDHILIASTSLIGSYAFVRGISLYAGRYPNEFTLAELLQKDLYEEIDPVFYAYFAAIVVMCTLSVIVQLRIRKKDKELELEQTNHPYYDLR